MPADIAPIQHNDHHQLVAQDFQSQKFHYEAIGEHVLQLEDYMIEDFAAERMGIFWHRQKPHYVGEKPWYRCMYGDVESAALFISVCSL